MLTAALLISCALGAVLAGGWLGFRQRARARVQAAKALCVALDDYAATLGAQDMRAPDADALWRHLERAKAAMRLFPQLGDDMWELTQAHGELTTFLLHGHMDRMGVHTTWPDTEQRNTPTFDALRDRALTAAQATSQRCRTINHFGA